MTWIPDVAPRMTISSAQYGNPIRDRVVQTFANMAEANTRLAVLPNGATMHLDDTGQMYHKQGGIWRAMFATLINGIIGNPAGFYLPPQQITNLFTIAIPAGYRFGRFQASITARAVNLPSTTGVASEVRMTLGGGSKLIGYAQWQDNANPTSHIASADAVVDVAGEAGVLTLQNVNGAASGDLEVQGNGYYTHYSALLTP